MMFDSVFMKTIWDRRRSLIIWSLALFGLALLYTNLYEAFTGEFDELFQEMPAAFEAFVGEVASISTPEGWLGIELYSLMLPIGISIITIGFGSGSIGKEEDSGSLELLLASSISRSKIHLQKLLAMAAGSGAVAASVWLGVAVGTLLFPFDISLLNTFWATLAGWLLAMVYGCVAMALQDLSGRRSFGLGVATGVLIATYFANTLSNLSESIEFMRYVSPFYYFNGQDILANGPNAAHMAVLALSAAAAYLVAHIRFRSRDIGVA